MGLPSSFPGFKGAYAEIDFDVLASCFGFWICVGFSSFCVSNSIGVRRALKSS